MKTMAVIPALNEAEHIEAVITKTKEYVDEVVVSDGLSTDGTREIAFNCGASVICGNPGYGRQIRRGLKYAQDCGVDIVVLLDSDGQHDPVEIPRMLEPILNDRADVVMGCRGEGMPLYRRLGNKMLTTICNSGSNFRPPDALTGYWAIRANKLPNLTEHRWGVAVELLIKARSNGCRMAKVDVKSIYHGSYKDNSTTTPLNLGLNLLWYVLKWRYRCEVKR